MLALEEVDQDAGDRRDRPDMGEDGQAARGQPQPGKPVEGMSAVRARCLAARHGMQRSRGDQPQKDEREADTDEQVSDRGKRVRLHGMGCAEKGYRRHHRTEGRAQRVERLGKGQVARRGAPAAHRRGQRVRRHLEKADARGDAEDRNQHHRKVRRIGGGAEQRRSRAHQGKADDRSQPEAEPRHQHAGGNRQEQIGQEERRLDQHDVAVAEREGRLDRRNGHVEHDRDVPPGEEQREQRQLSGPAQPLAHCGRGAGPVDPRTISS